MISRRSGGSAFWANVGVGPADQVLVVLEVSAETGPQLRESGTSLAREILLIFVYIRRGDAKNSIRRHILNCLLYNLSVDTVESRLDGARRDDAVNEVRINIAADFCF